PVVRVGPQRGAVRQRGRPVRRAAGLPQEAPDGLKAGASGRMIEEVTRRLARSRSLVDLGRWEDAAAEASLALAAEPTSVEALCLLAQSQLNLGRAAEACATAEAALRLAPAAEWPHRIHSVALGSLGRHPEAVAAARRAVRL